MYNSQEIAKTIRAFAKSKNVPIGKMLSDCELSVNALSSMQAGGYYPRLEAICKIADYLGCSVDYLLGRGDLEKKIEKKINKLNIELYSYRDNVAHTKYDKIAKSTVCPVRCSCGRNPVIVMKWPVLSEEGVRVFCPACGESTGKLKRAWEAVRCESGIRSKTPVTAKGITMAIVSATAQWNVDHGVAPSWLKDDYERYKTEEENRVKEEFKNRQKEYEEAKKTIAADCDLALTLNKHEQLRVFESLYYHYLHAEKEVSREEARETKKLIERLSRK